MVYIIEEHTADMRILARGTTLGELFSEALAGMMEVISPVSAEGEQEIERTVRLEAPDETVLLIDFLNTALLSTQLHREAYDRVTFKHISPKLLEAVLHGFPARSWKRDIKAVTFHGAQITKAAGSMLQTAIVFDI